MKKGFVFGLVLLAVGSVWAADVDVLYDRLKADLISTATQNPDDLLAVPGLLASMNPDGSWSDIDYASDLLSNWPPYYHLVRLKEIARAYHVSTNAVYQDSAVLNQIISGLNYWYQVAPKSDNWWYGGIGKQLSLGPICILLRDELPSEMVDQIVVDLHVSSPGFGATGLNLVDHSKKFIWAGAITGTESDVLLGRNAVASSIVCAGGQLEGIKPDGSFWQHGSMLATLSYGMGWFESVGHYAAMFKDLPYEFSLQQIDILSAYSLGGMQWATRGGYGDHAAQGRSITRPHSTDISQVLVAGCESMMIADPGRAALYQNFKSNVEGTLGGNANGNRHYWLSDFNVHRRSGYMAGLKIASLRTKIPESVNGENKHGFYQGVGSMTLLVDGDEYFDIYPVWDWGLYPGTTTRHRTPDEPGNRTGLTGFAGGASDETYGAVGYDMSWDGVTGKKAWFFFDEEFVALGNSLSSSAAEDICTTLNQCNRDGNVLVEYGAGSGSVNGDGTHTLTNPKWVYHDKVGYIFPLNGSATLKLTEQSGSWYEINNNYSSDTVSNDVFSLYLNHGVAPSGGSYEYIVMPDSTPSEVQASVAADEIDIVQNTSSIQAVYHNGLSRGEIVFYQAGSVTIRPGFTVAVDQPCILLINESDPFDIEITASNPKNTVLSLMVDTLIDGDAATTIFHFTGAMYVGSSFTQQPGEETIDLYPMITTTMLTITEPDVPYADTVSMSGGNAPFVWSIIDGTLPSGLTLGATNGVISGTPVSAGNYSFTVQVADNDGDIDQKELSLLVEIPPNGNQVLNGSFEDGGTAPLFWNMGSTAQGTTNDAVHGISSLVITQPSSPASQSISTKIGTIYNLSVWINAAGLAGGSCVFDTGDKYDGTCQFVIDNVSDANGWKLFSGSFIATDTVVNLRIFSVNASTAGTIYFDNILLVPVDTNEAPQFISTPAASVLEGDVYSYTVVATDADGDILTVSAPVMPAWLTFTNNVLSGMPSASDLGQHDVMLSVSDEWNNINQVFTIQVTSTSSVMTAGIIGSFTTGGAAQTWNLTEMGQADWAYWDTGFSPAPGAPTNKKNGGAMIGSMAATADGEAVRGSTVSFTTADFTFTDGTSISSGAADNLSGLFNSTLANGKGLSLGIDLPTTDMYRLYIWTSAYNCTGQMTISLNGVTDYVHAKANINSKPSWLYMVDVKAHNAGDDVTIQYLTTASVGGSPHAIISAVAVSAVSRYDAWASSNGIIGDSTDDDDLDGLNNFCEYAIYGKPTLTQSGSTFYYVHKQRTDDPNLSVELQTTTNLVSGSWTNTGYSILGTNVTGETYNEVTNRIPADRPQSYIRLKIIN